MPNCFLSYVWSYDTLHQSSISHWTKWKKRSKNNQKLMMILQIRFNLYENKLSLCPVFRVASVHTPICFVGFNCSCWYEQCHLKAYAYGRLVSEFDVFLLHSILKTAIRIELFGKDYCIYNLIFFYWFLISSNDPNNDGY